MNCGTTRASGPARAFEMAPDYVHWQGFYEVAKSFYTKFLPLVQELSPQVAEELLRNESHRWIGHDPGRNRSDAGIL